MEKENTTYVVATPLDLYSAVKGNKSHTQKDDLVLNLVMSCLSDAYESRTAEDACQNQLAVIDEWCFAPVRLAPHQSELVSKLLSINKITKVCVLSLDPIFDLYVIGKEDNAGIYDIISEFVVAYKYDNRASAAYMYMSENEFRSCNMDGIIQVYSK